MMHRFLLCIFLLAAGPVSGQNMDRVRQTVADLASPDMHGRGYVKDGDKKAAWYIQRRLEALKTEPFETGYFQSFTLGVNTFGNNLKLKAGLKKLQPGTDFLAAATSGKGEGKAKTIYFDTVLFRNEIAGKRFLQQPMRRKVLVIKQADYDRLITLPDEFKQQVHKAKAVVILQQKLVATVGRRQASKPVFEVLESAWPTGAKKTRFKVDARFKPDYETQNVIAFIKGSIYPDSFLVLTAHYDHLGRQSKDVYFPGANDNASGTAMLLELADWYAQPENQPRYSVAFMAFGAEEAGLVGSEYYTNHPLFPLSQIKFLLNLDLMSTGDDGIMVVNGKLFEKEFKLLSGLNDRQKYLPEIRSRGKASNSDHYHFTEKGVKAFFFYTLGGTTYYHHVNDTADTLPFTRFPEVFKLITDFLGAL
jgi:aminopeptidase YwaD